MNLKKKKHVLYSAFEDVIELWIITYGIFHKQHYILCVCDYIFLPSLSLSLFGRMCMCISNVRRNIEIINSHSKLYVIVTISDTAWPIALLIIVRSIVIISRLYVILKDDEKKNKMNFTSVV